MKPQNELRNYRLLHLYDDEDMLKQYYLWQLAEEHKDRFCCTPVRSGRNEYSDEGWLAFREVMLNEVRTSCFVNLLQSLETSKYLGWVCLSNYNPRNKCAEISFYLPPEHRGKGYGTELLVSILKIVFSDDFHWKLHKVLAETGAHNTASSRLLEKVGFHLDGRVRDHYWLDGNVYDQMIYTMLNAEYQCKGK